MRFSIAKAKWCWIALLVGQSYHLYGQDILWEKSVHIEVEQLYSVCQSSDNQILTGGNLSKYGTYVPGNSLFFRAALLKYTNEGDTLWLKKLPILGSVKNLFLNESGMIWATCQVTNPNTDPLNNFYFPAVMLLANDSSIVVNQQFPDMHHFEVGDSYPTVDGGLIVFGSKQPSTIPGFQMDFYAFKVNALGVLEWSRPYNPGPTNNFCQGGHVEPMANGRFLASGSMGSRIVSFEIDPETGNDTNFVQWYQTPSNHIFDVPGVVQAPDSMMKVIGTKRRTPSLFYFGHHKTSSEKIWGGEQLGGALQPIQNSDGSCILIYGTSATQGFISRVNADSTIAWHISSTNASQIQGRKVFYDCLYTEDQSGILVGYNLPTTGGTSRDFYIAKFSNIGQPFDPTGVKQPHLVKTDALPFPNPTDRYFQFKKEYQKGEVHLFTVEGKRVKSEQLKTKGLIDVSTLPAGTYLYRAVLDGKPHWGKIVKR